MKKLVSFFSELLLTHNCEILSIAGVVPVNSFCVDHGRVWAMHRDSEDKTAPVMVEVVSVSQLRFYLKDA